MIRRKIKQINKGSAKIDGAGVKLTRVIGYNDVKSYDPFLMLDAFDSKTPADYVQGFPWHPHRGIETVTYLIHGSIEHGDSLGNKGSITDGQCQWMTAGSGIIHQEMPEPVDWMQGVQLWINLPKSEKMTEPKYRDISEEMIPVIEESAGTIRIVAGSYNNIQGGIIGDHVKSTLLDVELTAEMTWTVSTYKDTTVFIYLVEGQAFFEESQQEPLAGKQAVLFESGESLTVKSGIHGCRFLLFEGLPLREPIAWGGPIVMNTQEELKQAFDEIDNGTFIKHQIK